VTAPAPTRRRPLPALAERAGVRAAAPAFALLLGLLSAGLAADASAQVAVSTSIESDYRVRGISFSDGKPVASLTVAYDHPSGLYLAATGVVGDTPQSGLRALGYQADLGYAARGPLGLVWDVGVANSRFTEYFSPRYELSYSEVYAGLAGKNLSAHLYYSPNYLGQDVATLYAEVDGVVHPAPHLRLFAHAGRLMPLDAPAGADFNRSQNDLRVGAALELKACELRLAWTSLQAHAYYPADQVLARHAVVFSATHAF
jgi:hypothetical protein